MDNFSELKKEKLDFSTYAKLPLMDDALVIEEPEFEDRKAKVLFKQWEKLNYLRKNLKILDQYIHNNNIESLSEWLKKNGSGMSDVVIKKIGKYNNETGGISAYFFNLQKLYDENEAKYDALEAKSKPGDGDEEAIAKMRGEREEKRKNRSQTRKALLKDLKANNKGYLKIEFEEEHPAEVEMAADGGASKDEPVKEDVKKTNPVVEKEADKVKNEIEKTGSKTGKLIVVIAGVSLAIATIAAVASSKNG